MSRWIRAGALLAAALALAAPSAAVAQRGADFPATIGAANGTTAASAPAGESTTDAGRGPAGGGRRSGWGRG
jgi:hypothetical protein